MIDHPSNPHGHPEPPAVPGAPPTPAPASSPPPAPALTAEQRLAIEAPPTGRLKIVAGAGSGKTEVLTRRVAALLAQGVAPRHLVAVTYTRKAAAEMKQRLVEKRGLSPRLFHEMEVNTFHGFLSRLLRRDPFAAGLDGADATVTETARQLLLEEVRESFEAAFVDRLISPTEGFEPTEAQALVREFPRALGQIRRFLLSPADFQAAVRLAVPARGGPLTATEERVLDWLHRFYALYLNALGERHLMDFDEILLRGEALVREWQEAGQAAGPRVFLIDEFQDNNREQLRIIERILAGREGHLTVVGDFRQSIYRFQGADVTTFVEFQATTEVVLRENFRSCREVVDLANAFIAPTLPASLPPAHLDQTSRRGPSPRPLPIACLLTDSEHPRAQAAPIAALIRQLVDGGLWLEKAGRPLTFGDVAIIVPSIRRLPASFEDPFLELGIPYQMSGGLGFYDRCEVAELVAFLRLLVNPYHDHSLVKVLTGPLFGLTDSELAGLALERRPRHADGEREPLWVRLEERRRTDPDRLPERARRFTGFFADLRTHSLTMGVLDLAYHLIEEAGFREYVAGQRNELRRRRMENNLAKFLAVVRAFEQSGVFTTLRDFLAWHDRLLDSEIEEEEAGLGLDERGAVKIMTIHKAKGLEFPLVILPDLKSRRYQADDRIRFSREEGLLVRPPGKAPPHAPYQAFHARERAAAEAEDKRKLYVAFTRAEELLVITGKQRLAMVAGEPLQFVKSWLERNPLAGRVLPLAEAPAVGAAWLAAGANPTPAGPPAVPPPPDLPALCEAMTAVRTFLERPTAAPAAVAVEEVFSLADLEQFETCPRRYFFTKQHLAPLVVREPSVAATVGNLVHQALRIFHGSEMAGITDSARGERKTGVVSRHPRHQGSEPRLPSIDSGGPSPSRGRGGDSAPERPMTGTAATGGGSDRHDVGSAPLPPWMAARNVSFAHRNGADRIAPPLVGGEGESRLPANPERPSLQGILDRLVPLHGPAGQAARPRAAAILERYAASPLAKGPVWLLEAEVNVRLVGPSGPFLVRGFTDRVDRDGPNTRLIDYKTHPYSPAAHAGYVRQMALYLAAARHGILGDRGALNFPEVCLAYLTEHGVEVHPAEPDTVAFEAWATDVVEAIRRETAWQPGSGAPCPDCGFLVLCGRAASPPR